MRKGPVLVAAAVLALASTAAAPHARAAGTAAVCRSSGVEMIVGGAVACASRRPALLGPGAPTTATAAFHTGAAEQRERDQERRRILLDELGKERAQAQRFEAEGDSESLRRARENLAALQRELGRLNP